MTAPVLLWVLLVVAVLTRLLNLSIPSAEPHRTLVRRIGKDRAAALIVLGCVQMAALVWLAVVTDLWQFAAIAVIPYLLTLAWGVGRR